MLRNEAKWLARYFESQSVDTLSPLLHLGSSTGEFRKVSQPFIDELIFSPLVKRGVKVIHVDIKKEVGVDETADIFTDDGFEHLANLACKTVLCANMMEHVTDIGGLRHRLVKLLPQNGGVVITVPFDFYYHADPIDNGFRPTPAELTEGFPELTLIADEIVECGSFREEVVAAPLILIKGIIRSLMPFFRFQGWRLTMHRWLWLRRSYKVSCVVLEK